MIKLEHTVLPSPDQMQFVIEGMRNPMNSWDRSDSELWCNSEDIDIGPDDLYLMKGLSKAGTVHRKYMRMMSVYVRITAPLYWWKEFDTYKVGTVANSCSTMHKIQAKEFVIDDFSTEHLLGFNREHFDKLDIPYIDIADDNSYSPKGSIECIIIPMLNKCREEWLACDKLLKSNESYGIDPEQTRENIKKRQKDIWWQMIQLLPSSYNQTRNVMLNYEVLTNIYESRKNHKLDEWREFCKWIEDLPYSELIINNEED